MTTAVELARASDDLRDWVFNLGLPFWSTTGLDRPSAHHRGRAACEHLGLDGRPAEPGYRRMRVQARQLYVFSEAAIQGVAGADSIAAGIHRFMTARGAAADGGWARRLRPDGSVLDPTNDLYDLAFVLFSLAHHARLTGEPAPLLQAERTLGFLRLHMARGTGGFANAIPHEPGWRQQNPHMHLLEAALELLAVSGDARWAELAIELVALCRQRLLDPATGTLGEFFTESWQRADGADGDLVEPGHHAEWIWLLYRHQALTGADTTDLIAPLQRTIGAFGIGPDGLLRDQIGRDGTVRLGSARLWVQGELIRAACALYRSAQAAGDTHARDIQAGVIIRATDNLVGRYLIGRNDPSGMPAGTWIDQLDARGQPKVDRIPTSSFYHIMTAWAELALLSLP